MRGIFFDISSLVIAHSYIYYLPSSMLLLNIALFIKADLFIIMPLQTYDGFGKTPSEYALYNRVYHLLKVTGDGQYSDPQITAGAPRGLPGITSASVQYVSIMLSFFIDHVQQNRFAPDGKSFTSFVNGPGKQLTPYDQPNQTHILPIPGRAEFLFNALRKLAIGYTSVVSWAKFKRICNIAWNDVQPGLVSALNLPHPHPIGGYVTF